MLLRSPLDAQHRALGAKMGAFAGWDMPISYGGTVSEHTAVRERVGLLAVQGPRSRAITERLFPAAKDLGYMRTVRDGDVLIARSGYTGEVGYEVFTTAEGAVEAWTQLLEAVRDAGGEPAGLAARDTLR